MLSIAVVACLGLSLASGRARGDDTTTVSLAFDGMYEDIAPVQQMLSTRGLHATFFANSALVGVRGRLSLDQLLSLQGDGNEVGGATAYGLDLISLDSLEQAREICTDRSWLLANGLDVRSFAYPSGPADPSPKAAPLVSQCGYNSARRTEKPCANCSATVIPLPPAQPLQLPSLPAIGVRTSLEDLKNDVLAGKQADGGWVIFVMHHLCDAASGCDNESISSSTLNDFLDFLVSEQARGVSVKTIGAVIDQPPKPAVAPPEATPPGPDGSLLQNGSLEEQTIPGGIPDCWQAGGEGINTFVFTRVQDPHDGQWGEQIRISDIHDGARRLVSKQDLGACAPAAMVGHRYRVRAWVKVAGVVKLIGYTREASGAWSYWSESHQQNRSDVYEEAIWITPSVPAGALGLSVGVTLESKGALTLDQLSLEDLGPADSSVGCSSSPLGSRGGVPALLAVLLWLGLPFRGIRNVGSYRPRRRD